MNKPPQRPSRSSQSHTPRSTGSVPADVERALALRDVMDHAVRVQREVTAPQRRLRTRAGLMAALALCVPLIALCVYSWVAHPEFIWGPSPRSETPQRRDASVRFAMFVLANRIEARRVATGRYPATLREVDETATGMTLRLLSDSVFELRTNLDGKGIVFRSNESPVVFLGNSPRVIGLGGVEK